MDELPDFELRGLFQGAMETAAGSGLQELIVETEDRYDVLRELGVGGRKQVCLARDRLTGREVALAVLKPPADDEAVERFLREARMLAQLQHPSIIPVYDVGISDEYGPYFTMKPADDANLEDVSKKLWKNKEVASDWPIAARLELFMRICDAVSYAHTHGIIHLDLKPANILLGEFGEAMISDWGIARKLDEVELDLDFEDEDLDNSRVKIVTQHGIVRGTPGYMAPEQMLAEETTPLTDVYGLGGILYSLLTSLAPVTGPNYETIEHRTLNGNVYSPIQCRPDLRLPEGLDAIVMKALARWPAHRYQSVSALQEDIEKFRMGFTPEAHNAGTFHRLKLGYRRNRLAANLLLLTTMISVTLIVVFVQRMGREKSAAVKARIAAITSLEEIALEHAENENLLDSLSQVPSVRIQQGELFASELVPEAEAALVAGDYRRAMTLLNSAIGMAPYHSAARELRGNLYVAGMNLERAEIDYGFVLVPSSQSLKEVIRKNARNRWDASTARKRLYRAVWMTLQSRDMKQLLNASIDLAPFDSLPVYEQIELRFELLRILNPKQRDWKPSLVMDGDFAHVNLSGHEDLRDIRALRGAPIKELDLSETAVEESDLRILRTLSLERFDYRQGLAVSSRYLALPKLRFLDVSHSKIEEIHSLVGVPIGELNIAHSQVRNLHPLRSCLQLKLLKVSQKQHKKNLLGSRVRVLIEE